MNAVRVSQENTGRNQGAGKRQGRRKSSLFAEILDTKTCESGQVSEALPTTVYGRDGRLSDIRYRSKEYHY